MFARTSVFAAAYKDNEKLLECLVHYGASLSTRDVLGDTVLDIARGNLSRGCCNKIRELQLANRLPIPTQYDQKQIHHSHVTSIPLSRPRTIASHSRYTVEKNNPRLLLSADSRRLTVDKYSQSCQNTTIVTPKGTTHPSMSGPPGDQSLGVRFRIVMPQTSTASSPRSPRLPDTFSGGSTRRDGQTVAVPSSILVSPQGIIWQGNYLMASNGRVPNPEPSQRPPTAESIPDNGAYEAYTDNGDGCRSKSTPAYLTSEKNYNREFSHKRLV